MSSDQKRVVTLYLESNPNPNSLKFCANFMILPEGAHLDFPDKESAASSPLASTLFDFEFVERVFFMSNFITITKNQDKEWVEIQDELRAFIKGYLEEGKDIYNFNKNIEEVNNVEQKEIDVKIQQVLEEYVRPAVEQDGGAITFHSFDKGIVKVLLQGSCSGCPSSTVTLKAGIENLLKNMVPGVEGVEAQEI